MPPFAYVGPDWQATNRLRRIFLQVVLVLGAVLLFPFTLLILFFWALGRLADRKQAASLRPKALS